jgi:hypothetical protein
MTDVEKVSIPADKPKVNPNATKATTNTELKNDKVETNVQPVVEIAPQQTINKAEDATDATAIIQDIEQENTDYEKELREKRRLKNKINAAIKAAETTRTEQNKNIRTGQILSEKTYYTKIRYETGETDENGEIVLDENGKPKTEEASIYDFMNDKEVTSILQFIVPKDDEENEFGDPITKTISFYWKNQQFI